MRWPFASAVFVIALASCAHSSGHAAKTAPLASAQPSAAPTPAFSDLAGVSTAPYIDQLTQLQVFWPAGGVFEPNKPVLRREFARWLLHADDAIWAAYPLKELSASHTDARQYFTDVPQTDLDFTAIEGLHDDGIVLASGTRFYPDRPITREEALAIKAYADCGAPDPMLTADAQQAYYELPPWRDRERIGREYVAAIASCLLQDQGTTPNHQLDTIGRTFGTISVLDPQRPLTRAEAAAMLWNVGQQKPDLNNFPPRSAADALAAVSTSQ